MVLSLTLVVRKLCRTRCPWAGSVPVVEDPVAFDAPIGDPDQPGPFGELERPAFHGNVADDGCGRMSSPTTWIRLSP